MRYRKSFSYCPSDYRRGDEDNPGSPYYDETKAMALELEELEGSLEDFQEDVEIAEEDGDPKEIAKAKTKLREVKEQIASLAKKIPSNYFDEPEPEFEDRDDDAYWDEISNRYEKDIGY